MADELYFLTIAEASNLIRSKKLSPVELTSAYLDRIKALNDTLHAYILPLGESALAEAKKAEAEIAAGHQALGLARSDQGAKALAVAGAKVHEGSLQDLESLKSGVAQSDGVIHLAFNHDFSKFAENGADERRACGCAASEPGWNPAG